MNFNTIAIGGTSVIYATPPNVFWVAGLTR
jgi:hypothetical protein